MSIKKCKEIFRIGHEVFTRKFKACKELRESVDPEVKPLVRRKRLKECGYKRTDTLWIKKLEDKSWKARAKKAHQWIRHKLGLTEKELVGKVNHAVCDDITFRLIDGSWNKLHELYGDKTCKDRHIYRQKEFIMSLMYLYEHKGCMLQLGGADQWGNITTGSELIRRVLGKEAYALTCPLITKADGGKFGKTEKGNVWLDPERTSPYQFYQFWLNVSDADAERYIKIFTMLSREEIEEAVAVHSEAPHLRHLQKLLAKEVTVMVHGEAEYRKAVAASEMLFGNATSEALKSLDEKTFLDVFAGVPTFSVSK